MPLTPTMMMMLSSSTMTALKITTLRMPSTRWATSPNVSSLKGHLRNALEILGKPSQEATLKIASLGKSSLSIDSPLSWLIT